MEDSLLLSLRLSFTLSISPSLSLFLFFSPNIFYFCLTISFTSHVIFSFFSPLYRAEVLLTHLPSESDEWMAFEMRALKEFSRIFPVEKKILERSYGEELEGAEDTEGKSKPVGVTVIVFVSEKMKLKITLLTNLSPLLSVPPLPSLIHSFTPILRSSHSRTPIRHR